MLLRQLSYASKTRVVKKGPRKDLETPLPPFWTSPEIFCGELNEPFLKRAGVSNMRASDLEWTSLLSCSPGCYKICLSLLKQTYTLQPSKAGAKLLPN